VNIRGGIRSDKIRYLPAGRRAVDRGGRSDDVATVAAGCGRRAQGRKDVLECVQRAALRVALRQVERARAAKARASPLERQRRVCDAWLRVMAMVRELPPFQPASTRALEFGDGGAIPPDYLTLSDPIPKYLISISQVTPPDSGSWPYECRQ